MRSSPCCGARIPGPGTECKPLKTQAVTRAWVCTLLCTPCR
ncbi:hypothetical protein DB31_1916 [Hyalangium minutum]|uniref:Uncharacterized protein n=1 Tax=Hyalangium minutum TaxID=394096 RepID=A0A085WB35_9BACT|nr:hypothetical protein DB31_1916 [Hyalangium minutum]